MPIVPETIAVVLLNPVVFFQPAKPVVIQPGSNCRDRSVLSATRYAHVLASVKQTVRPAAALLQSDGLPLNRDTNGTLGKGSSLHASVGI